MFGEAGELRRVEYEEDLIRWRIRGEAVILRRECRADTVCHGDGVRTAALVESVCEERVELEAEHASFCEQRAVLLDDGEEMRHHVRPREDDRLAKECAAFRSADAERIREARDGGERQLVRRAAERICEPCPVEEERDPMRAADGADRLKLIHRIESSVLGRMGDVDHAGVHRMIAVRVLVVGAQGALDGVCGELAVLMRQGEHLVAAALDCARLVYRDMPRIRRDNTLIGPQQRRDYDAVHLRPAGEEMHLCARRTA